MLASALDDTAGGRALVIDPNGQRATRMAGLLQELGYRVELSASGREGFRGAASGAGANLVAVHANVADIPVSQFAANLRADARTRKTPLVVYGDARLERAVGRLADRAAPAAFVEFPNAPDILGRQIAGLGGRPPLPDELKSEQKRAAARELARLAARRDGVFPLGAATAGLAAATADAAVAADAAGALAAIPTAEAQQALATTMLVVRPEGGALAAAAGLTDSVRRFGSLLPAETVARLKTLPKSAEDERLRDAFLSLSAALPGGAEALPVEVRLPVE